MGRSKVDKKKDDKVEATLCPKCSYEHVIVPMFRIDSDNYHCLLCKTSYVKRVNGRTLFIPLVEPDVEFEADFEISNDN
jgi:hypothetical protein|tara:strand:+ start:547 stop:783 length:237 start_codon:yes stop_codon:yes gene_type:complete